jgi:hypothetical protein
MDIKKKQAHKATNDNLPRLSTTKIIQTVQVAA